MNSGLLMTLLQLSFQFAERGELAALEFPDPTFADLMDRHRVEVMQLLAAVPEGRDQVGGLQDRKVLGHGLPRHGETVAEFVQRLSIPGVKPVEQRASRCIGQRFEDLIHGFYNRQPNGCMSSGCFGGWVGCARECISQREIGPESPRWRKHEALCQTGDLSFGT